MKTKAIISGGSGPPGTKDFPTIYITEMTINHSVSESIYTPRVDKPGYEIVGHIPGMLPTAVMTLEMTATEGAIDIVHSIMRKQQGYSFGIRRDEWRCVWCGSVHPIMENVCSHCGGPRGWLM